MDEKANRIVELGKNEDFFNMILDNFYGGSSEAYFCVSRIVEIKVEIAFRVEFIRETSIIVEVSLGFQRGKYEWSDGLINCSSENEVACG